MIRIVIYIVFVFSIVGQAQQVSKFVYNLPEERNDLSVVLPKSLDLTTKNDRVYYDMVITPSQGNEIENFFPVTGLRARNVYGSFINKDFGGLEIDISMQQEYIINTDEFLVTETKDYQIVWTPKLKMKYQLSKKLETFTNVAFPFNHKIKRRNKFYRAQNVDVGFSWNPKSTIVVQGTLWTFQADNGFSYLDDEGLVDMDLFDFSGVTLAFSYAIKDWLSYDMTLSYAEADIQKPELYTEGGWSMLIDNQISMNLGYRYSSQSTIKSDFFTSDLGLEYTFDQVSVSFSIQNIFNHNWSEPEFVSAYRLTNEIVAVKNSYFVPDDSIFMQVGITYNL